MSFFFFIQMNFGDEDKGCEVCGVGWGFTVVVVSDVQYLIMKPQPPLFIHRFIHASHAILIYFIEG